MRILIILSFFFLVVSCTGIEKSHKYKTVTIETVYEDSTSIRAIELMPGSLAFAGSNGVYGTVDIQNQKVRSILWCMIH